jgi:hypothetical protein
MVQILLSYSVLSENMKMKPCRTIFSLVLYGCETPSFTLTEGHRLRVLKSRVLRELLWSKRG